MNDKPTPTPPDFRALCAELLAAVEHQYGDSPVDRLALSRRARAALEAQPEPQGPSDEELDDQFFEHCYTDDFGNELMEPQQFRKGARAVLTRYGCPAIEPVLVSERPPEREGWWDEQGRYWIPGIVEIVPVPTPANTINQED
jgi:hypothetical protein